MADEAALAEAAIADAVKLHREGRLAEAAAAYQDILRAHPDHAGVLHNLGVVAAERLRFEAHRPRRVRRRPRFWQHLAEKVQVSVRIRGIRRTDPSLTDVPHVR